MSLVHNIRENERSCLVLFLCTCSVAQQSMNLFFPLCQIPYVTLLYSFRESKRSIIYGEKEEASVVKLSILTDVHGHVQMVLNTPNRFS